MKEDVRAKLFVYMRPQHNRERFLKGCSFIKFIPFSRVTPVVLGPALPPGYKRGERSSSSDESDQEVSYKRAKTSHTAVEE